jgi:hypothetical protein
MRSILGISLGAALAGLITLCSASDAPAQGSMTNMGGSGYRDGKAAVGHRNAARPGPAMKGHGYRPKPLAKGYRYQAGPRVKGYSRRAGPLPKGYYYAPAPRVQRYSYRPAPRLKGRAYRPRARGYRSTGAPGSCGQFKYWSSAKGRCLDARTSPPALK